VPPVEARTLTHGTLPTRTVAVLPFRVLGGDPDDEYIGLGIAELVLNRLADSNALDVIARNSAFAATDHGQDIKYLGRVLGARYIVQGTVQRRDEMLRVSVQLVDAHTARQVKGFTKDRALDDLFAIQDEIALLVSEAFDLVLPGAPPGTLRMDAQLEYLQGLAALGRYRVVEAERALQHFRRASGIDPGFAAAYAHEALAIMQRAELLGLGHGSVTAEAVPLLEHALALDPSLAEAYLARALLSTDRRRSEADLRRAVELAPSNSEGHLMLAENLGIQAYLDPVGQQSIRPGSSDEMQRLLERAARLDPLRPRPRYLQALMEFHATGDDMAFEAGLLEVLRIDPEYSQALNRLALLQAGYRGRFADGIVLIERALAADPDSAFTAQCAVDLYLAINDIEAASDFEVPGLPEIGMARLLRAARETSVPKTWSGRSPIGMVHAMAGILVVRDAGLRDRDYPSAMEALRARYCLPLRGQDMPCMQDEMLYAALAHGQLSIAAGNRRQGRRIIESVLERLDSPESRVSPNLGHLLRAAALLSIGRRGEALSELDAARASGPSLSWWVMLEHDQAFESVRDTAEFRAVLSLAREHAARERSALSKLRSSGTVPKRPSTTR